MGSTNARRAAAACEPMARAFVFARRANVRTGYAREKELSHERGLHTCIKSRDGGV